jgi:hypothetical protein
MDYRKIYTRLIERGKGRKYVRETHHNHHIVPRCLGGSNDKENIAVLTHKEHFLAHWLLTKLTEGKDRILMLHALFRMYQISPKNPEGIKSGWRYTLSKKAQSEAMRNQPSRKGFRHSTDTIQRISTTCKNNPIFKEIGLRTYETKTEEEKKDWHAKGAKKSNVTRSLETKRRVAKIASDAAKLVSTKDELSLRGKKGAEKANSISPQERSERQKRAAATRRKNGKIFFKSGVCHPKTKLNEETVILIFNFGGSHKKNAEIHDTTYNVVYGIKNGTSWGWLTGKKRQEHVK